MGCAKWSWNKQRHGENAGLMRDLAQAMGSGLTLAVNELSDAEKIGWP